MIVFLKKIKYTFRMTEETKQQIKAQLETINTASNKISTLLGFSSSSKNIITTKKEFDDLIDKFVTSSTMKTNLLNGKKELKKNEIYWFEDRGIPHRAWEDIAWFRKLLK